MTMAAVFKCLVAVASRSPKQLAASQNGISEISQTFVNALKSVRGDRLPLQFTGQKVQTAGQSRRPFRVLPVALKCFVKFIRQFSFRISIRILALSKSKQGSFVGGSL